jgi:hypothetical protein
VRKVPLEWLYNHSINFHKIVYWSIQYHRLRKTANIIGQKLLSLKPVVRTRRSYKRAGLIKRQKSFQGLATYGHEMLMSLQMRAKLIGTQFSPFYASDIRLYQMTVYSMEKRLPGTVPGYQNIPIVTIAPTPPQIWICWCWICLFLTGMSWVNLVQ